MLADSFVDRLGECQQAHALEELARGVAGPDVLGMLPEPFVESTFDALAQRPGTRMLFEAASRVCAPSLVPRMQELAAARAAEGDRTSTLVSQVGELTFEELFRIDSEGDEDGCVVRLSRPRQKRSQLLLFSRDRRLPQLPLRVGSLTEPLSPRQIDGIFAGMRGERDVPVPAAVDEFPAWFVDGARASAELRLGPTAEGGELAVQLLRQLGEPELADRLARLFPLELDYDEDGGELEEAQHESLLDEADEVAGDFARWLAENASGLGEEEISLARLDVGLALEFRANYLGAGVGGVWTDEELDAFLLSYVPRKVMTSEDDRARMPDSLVRMFRFLGERGDVIPPAAEKLALRAAALSETFARRAGDPTRRGLSGALFAAMAAADVDFTDAGAVQAWIAEFNERPIEERDAILGLSLPDSTNRGLTRDSQA